MSNLFHMGQVVMTRGIADRVAEDEKFAEFVYGSLARHSSGDWGDLCEEDRASNEEALHEAFRLFSAYKLNGQEKIWIITEADRSATTILFPDEY